jgi:hypothetical protein
MGRGEIKFSYSNREINGQKMLEVDAGGRAAKGGGEYGHVRQPKSGSPRRASTGQGGVMGRAGRTDRAAAREFRFFAQKFYRIRSGDHAAPTRENAAPTRETPWPVTTA